jgi:mercuric ion transport protein
MNQRIYPPEPLGSLITPKRAGPGLSVLGALASFGAVFAAASCCVLPLGLAALGVGAGLSSAFAALIPLRWPLTILSIIGLAGGWWFYARRRRACASDQSCSVRLPSRTTPVMLAIGTAMTVIALLWDQIEAPLMKALS